MFEKSHFLVILVSFHYYKKYNKNAELLFELDNIKEWSIENNNIYSLSNDTIYSYNEENGLNKIIEYNELNYNYKNIYKVWSN